ncbi:MAG: SusD/RagB family nutrient-binding outer membrane lipoprotein [Bacteroidota bacterium]
MRRYRFQLIPLLVLLLSSCQFGDTNVDPINPTSATLDEVLPIAIVQTYRNINAIGGRVTGIVMQQLKGVDAQPLSYEQYLIDERTLDNLWRTGLYAGAMRDCDWLIKQTEKEEADVRYAAIARILLAHNLGLATAYWGDIPFSEAFVGDENLYPTYDRQEEIYEQIFRLLEQAVNELNQVETISELTADLIFGGDTANWRATAFALMARYSLHKSKRESDCAANTLAYLAQGAIQSPAQQPLFNYLNNRNGGNPFALYLEERAGQIVLGDYLSNLLQSSGDPRLNKMAKLEDGEYTIYDGDATSFFWTRLDTPIPLISLTEVLFIEAEALLRSGELALAEEKLRVAVTSHFEQMQCPASEYQDWLTASISFDCCTSDACRLERIIQQKYIALYVQGAHEAWNDYRRTGYPELMVPVNANTSFNPSLVIPKRYLYPLNERTANQAAYQEAIDRQGGHFLDADTWIFAD